MKNSKIYTIVAVEKNFGIGKNGFMPWSFRKEMAHFTKTTLNTKDPAKQNGLLMGWVTWESLPVKYRPLPGRKNVILSRDPYEAPGEEVFDDINAAIERLRQDSSIENIFIMGGASIYKYAVENLDLDGLYITHIDKDYDCDTFFPRVPGKYSKETILGEEEEGGVKFKFMLYEKY